MNTFAFLFLSEEYKQYVWAFVLPISVVLQELIRVFFMVMYGKMRQASIMEGASEEDRDRLTDTQHPSKLSDIIGIGLGFAAGSSMLMFFPVLWEARGSGLLFSQACPNVPIYLVSGTMLSSSRGTRCEAQRNESKEEETTGRLCRDEIIGDER